MAILFILPRVVFIEAVRILKVVLIDVVDFYA